MKHALRSPARTPGFTVVALATLALAIGANTALFSVVRGVLLRPLPYAAPDQLVYLWMNNPGTQLSDDVTSWPMFHHWRKHGTTLAQSAVYTTTTAFNYTGDGEPERLSGTYAGEQFLETLGVAPLLGRWFTAEEQERGKDFVTIIGHGFWQRPRHRPRHVGTRRDKNPRRLLRPAPRTHPDGPPCPRGFRGGRVALWPRFRRDPMTALRAE